MGTLECGDASPLSILWIHGRYDKSKATMHRRTPRSTRDIRVEHADFFPVVTILGDEPLMPLVDLVLVVSLATLKDDLQGDVEIALVHGPRQIRHERSHREENGSFMACKVVFAGPDHRLDRCG
jgi:hypothetical protein